MDIFKQFIKDNPSKVLGEIKETTDRFGNPDITIVGDADLINQIDVSDSILPSKSKSVENIGASQFSEDEAEKRVEESLNITKANKAKGSFKAVKQKKKGKKFNLIIEGDSEQDTYSFKESHDILNKGISDDVVGVWLWYNIKKGVSLNEYAESLVPNDTDEWKEKQMSLGNLCYDAKLDEFFPAIIYYSGNIYDRIEDLERYKSLYADKGFSAQYDKQLKQLNNIIPHPLKLVGKQDERLVLSVLSRFVREFTVNIDGEVVSLIDAFTSHLSSLELSDMKFDVQAWHISSYYIRGDRMPNYWDKFEKIALKRKAAQECVIQMSKFLAEELDVRERDRVEFAWNKQNNGYVDVSYDRIPLFMQFSKFFKKNVLGIRDAQREGIAFQTSNGTGIIAYDVGVGKTLTAILNIGYAMQNGICKRPLIVVPKPTYDKWISEINGVYEDGVLVGSGLLPQYPIVDLFNLDKKRQAALFDDDGNFKGIPEGTISICTYEGMSRIGFGQDSESDFIMELKEILNQGFSGETERKKALDDEKLNKMLGVAQEGTILNIDDAKFDYLTIDEAHNFNKIFPSVKGESNEDGKRDKNNYQIRGTQSSRAIKAFFLSSYIQKTTRFGNICLLTATPFTNNPLEVYNILALTNIKRLAQKGVKGISAFFDNYVNQTFEKVIKSTGDIVEAAVIKGWNNKISLQKILFSYMNYKSGEDANIQRPEKWTLPKLSETVDGVNIPLPADKQIPTYLKPTDKQKRIQVEISEWLVAQLEDEELAKKAPYLVADIMAKKNCISPYIYEEKNPFDIDPADFIESSPKLKYTMECVKSVRDWHISDGSPVSGQVIYINGGVDYLFIIKDYLTNNIGYKKGVYEHKKGKFFDEVEILAGSGGFKRSDDEKEQIKDLFNKGVIKMIIGTSTIREGIDLQVKSTCLYSLWIDWNPTSYKQLEGRIWRFGNEFKNVRIVSPLLVGSSDAFTYQKLEEKTARINDIFDRNDKSNMLDVGEEDREAVKWALVDDLSQVAKAKIKDKKTAIHKEIEVVRGNIKSIENVSYLISNTDSHVKIIRNFNDLYFKYADISGYEDFNANDPFEQFKAISRQEDSIYQKLMDSNVSNYYSFRRELSSTMYQIKQLKKDYKKLDKLDADIKDKYNVSIYSEELDGVKEGMEKSIDDLTLEGSRISSTEYFDKVLSDLEAERKKFNSGVDNYQETVDRFKELNYLLGELRGKEQLPVKSKKAIEVKPRTIEVKAVETKTAKPTLLDLKKRQQIVSKMAKKNPSLKARVSIINKMIKKLEKETIIVSDVTFEIGDSIKYKDAFDGLMTHDTVDDVWEEEGGQVVETKEGRVFKGSDLIHITKYKEGGYVKPEYPVKHVIVGGEIYKGKVTSSFMDDDGKEKFVVKSQFPRGMFNSSNFEKAELFDSKDEAVNFAKENDVYLKVIMKDGGKTGDPKKGEYIASNSVYDLYLTDDRNLIRVYTNESFKDYDDEIILKRVPKSDKARKKQLQKIEEKANLNRTSNQTPILEQQENYESMYNRYERQWEDFATLIYGWNYDFNRVNLDYDYGDVIA